MNTFVITLDGIEFARTDYIFVARAAIEAIVKRYGPLVPGALHVDKDGDDWTEHFIEY